MIRFLPLADPELIDLLSPGDLVPEILLLGRENFAPELKMYYDLTFLENF